MVKLEDVQVSADNNDISLRKLTGRRIVDIRGFVEWPSGYPLLRVTEVILEDGTVVELDGAHEVAFVQNTDPELNLDEATLEGLYVG